MASYDQLMLEAQQIISVAETRYERQRYHNGGDVTTEMEDEWHDAMKRAETIQAEAARERWQAEVAAQQRDSNEAHQSQQEMRMG